MLVDMGPLTDPAMIVVPSAATESAGDPASRKMKTIPVAVERALALTEKQSYQFIRVAGCNSCHSQDLPSAAAGFARARGLNWATAS